MRMFAIVLLAFSFQLSAQELDLSWIDADAASKSHIHEIISGQRQLQTDPLVSSNITREWAESLFRSYDLTHSRLLLTLDPAIRYITGSVTHYYRILSEPPHALAFNLHDSLEVIRITYHGEILEDFSHENHLLQIDLPGAMAFQTLDSIMIDYQGVPPETGLGSFAVSDHNGTPIISTLSQPYGAQDWWPCKQDLTDKIDSVLVVSTTPEAYRTASNGILLSEEVCHGNRIMQWKHQHPIAAYLVAVSVTNYVDYSDYVVLNNGDSIEILNYVYPESLEEVKTRTPGIIEVFHLFNSLFGLYPYADEKYGHAQWEFGGGMEHQTMSFMGSFGHDLMAHELAHQWFGDYVTCASWQDIWLNEGFATYLTGLTYEHMMDGKYWEPFKRLSIDRIIREPGGSVFCYDTTDVQRIFDARLSYSKGAMVLHSLRWEMGDEDFFDGIRDYYATFANDYATTEDFKEHMEAAADTSLTGFFDDWIYQEGFPEYQYSWTQNDEQAVEITLWQTQSHPSVDFFEMHVEVLLQNDHQDTSIVVHHTADGQSFTVNPGFRVNDILLDPNRWIITKNPILLNIDHRPSNIQHPVLYPNPATDQVHVTIPPSGYPENIQLLNSAGQTIMELVIPAGERIGTLVTGNLPSGRYFVRIGKNLSQLIIQ